MSDVLLNHLTLFGAFFVAGLTFGFAFAYIVVTSTEKRL